MYDIRNYGAIADGVTINSAAIQAAIDDCAANGGGRVLIPTGTFKTGTIWLKSNVELHLEMGAKLLASDNLDDYNELDAYPQNYSYTPEEWVGKHLIIAHEIHNVAITGLGEINGNGNPFYLDEIFPGGPYWWSTGRTVVKDKVNFRPGQMICFIESNHIHIENITIRNATCWCCFFHGCEHIIIKGLKVFNPKERLNTDGIDLDCCRYVTVSDCLIDTGDDAIAIRCAEKRLKNPKPCEYITVTNCVFAVCASAIRISVGTGFIRHIRFSNITVHRAGTMIKLQTSYNGNGCAKIEDVNFSNFSGTNTNHPINMLSGNGAYIKNITMENIRAEGFGMTDLQCDDDGLIDNVTLRNIELRMKDLYDDPLSEEVLAQRGHHCLRIHGVTNSLLDQVRICDSLSQCPEPVSITDCTNLETRNCNF